MSSAALSSAAASSRTTAPTMRASPPWSTPKTMSRYADGERASSRSSACLLPSSAELSDCVPPGSVQLKQGQG